jgi:hypothetical protein
MTTGIKASEERFNAIVNRRKELESDYMRIYTELKEAEDASAERILEGASIEAETKRIQEQRLQREQVAAALELSKAREAKAQEAFRQKQLEDAWTQARRIWTRNFKTVDKITVAASKLLPEKDALQKATNELNRLGGQFTSTEGPGMFMPEARILQQAEYMLDVLGKQLERLEAARANYDSNYTEDRRTGNLGEG